MAAMTDTLIFASPLMRREPEKPATQPWKILVVDDEPDIHAITKIALSDFTLDDRGITQLHAYSAKEARNILEENPDIAMLLLDVVMESDEAGLDLVRYIRNVLGNKAMRIVLRTGNPGHAPERRVIAEFDINDYREKSELTTQKLNTVMYTALRSYRDILTSEEEKKQLEKLVDMSVSLFMHRTPEALSSNAISSITDLLHRNEPSKKAEANALLGVIGADEQYSVLHATGTFSTLSSDGVIGDLPPDMADAIRKGLKQEDVYFDAPRAVAHTPGPDNVRYLVHTDGVSSLSEADKRALAMLLRSVTVAFRALDRGNEQRPGNVFRIH